MADPLEVPETEAVVSALESMQSQITAARTLVAFLGERRTEANYVVVEEQLNKADAHLREAVKIACSGHDQCGARSYQFTVALTDFLYRDSAETCEREKMSGRCSICSFRKWVSTSVLI